MGPAFSRSGWSGVAGIDTDAPLLFIELKNKSGGELALALRFNDYIYTSYGRKSQDGGVRKLLTTVNIGRSCELPSRKDQAYLRVPQHRSLAKRRLTESLCTGRVARRIRLQQRNRSSSGVPNTAAAPVCKRWQCHLCWPRGGQCDAEPTHRSERKKFPAKFFGKAAPRGND